MNEPLAIDLYCGLGGWTDGLLAAGFDVVGYDIERHKYGDHRYPAQLILQDVRTLDGARFKDAALIVASPPCQEFSYMAMPWKRAKQIARALRGEDEFPADYTGSRTVAELTALFDACFRIQREACAAAGWHIPLVVENVRGAQAWVGRAAWHHGSYYLWGDVPALMPTTLRASKSHGMNWNDRTKRGQDFTRIAGEQAIKGIPHRPTGHWTNPGENGGIKQGGDWFGPGDPSAMRCCGSKSTARKAASALIAKIPFDLALHIGRTYLPQPARVYARPMGKSVTDRCRIIQGDALAVLREQPDGIAQTCITSPPYWGLRDYGADGQLGLERTPEEYVANLVAVFTEVRRVLRDDGALWINLGDSYANDGKWGGASGGKHVVALHGDTKVGRRKRDTGLKPKDLVGIPWRVAFALQADGWWLRCDIIWSKPNPMPESVTDRPTKAHEYLFLLAKSARYYYDAEAIKEPASLAEQVRHVDHAGIACTDGIPGQGPHTGLHRRTDKQRGHGRRHAGFNDRWDAMERAEQCSGIRNKRSVWTIATHPYPEAHFATYPEKLVEPCVLAGSREGDLVLDPFCGSGTTGAVALRLRRRFLGIELNPAYIALAEKRIKPNLAQGVLL